MANKKQDSSQIMNEMNLFLVPTFSYMTFVI